MPATTPIYGLPYQVGSDPPCFGPGTGCDNLESVWCDFAALVEAQLDENDLIIGRTSASIPMAQVAMETATDEEALAAAVAFNTDAAVHFDSVIFDTDNMANLPLGITPQRNGIYHLDAFIKVTFPGSLGTTFNFQIVSGAYFNADREIAALEALVSINSINYFRASTLYAVTGTAPAPRVFFLGTLGALLPAGSMIRSAALTAYWHSDL